MQRIEVHTTAGKLVIVQTRAGQIADAVVNAVVALFLFFAFAYPIAAAFHGASSRDEPVAAAYLLLSLAGPLWFIVLAALSCARAFFPARSIFDRESDVIAVNGKPFGALADLAGLQIRYTGLVSPSRYTLFAVASTGRAAALESTGYFGSRDELRALCDLIADFTGRIDLYSHS